MSRTEIVQVGMRIVREEGLGALSMRRIARDLDTGPSGLYLHVANKDELLRLLVDAMYGQVPVPKPDPARWKAQVKELARTRYQTMVAHAGLAQAAVSTRPTGPNALRISEAMLAMLLLGGLPSQVAANTLNRLLLYTSAEACAYSVWHADRRGTGMADHYARLPEDVYPAIREHAHNLLEGSMDERFEFGLGMLVDGLEGHPHNQWADRRSVPRRRGTTA